jgi:hypothetical protein
MLGAGGGSFLTQAETPIAAATKNGDQRVVFYPIPNL